VSYRTVANRPDTLIRHAELGAEALARPTLIVLSSTASISTSRLLGSSRLGLGLSERNHDSALEARD